jgi:hypothetical protein
MKKKLYLEPEMEIVKMDALTFFAASGVPGAEGGEGDGGVIPGEIDPSDDWSSDYN